MWWVEKMKELDGTSAGRMRFMAFAELAIFAAALLLGLGLALCALGTELAKHWRRHKLEALMRRATAGLFTVHEASTLTTVRSALRPVCAFLDECAAAEEQPEQAVLTTQLAQSLCFTSHSPADLMALRLLAALGPSWWMLGLAKEGLARSKQLRLLRRVPAAATEWWRTAGATAEQEAAKIPLVPLQLPLQVWEALCEDPASPPPAPPKPPPLESLVLACALDGGGQSAYAASAYEAAGDMHAAALWLAARHLRPQRGGTSAAVPPSAQAMDLFGGGATGGGAAAGVLACAARAAEAKPRRRPEAEGGLRDGGGLGGGEGGSGGLAGGGVGEAAAAVAAEAEAGEWGGAAGRRHACDAVLLQCRALDGLGRVARETGRPHLSYGLHARAAHLLAREELRGFGSAFAPPPLVCLANAVSNAGVAAWRARDPACALACHTLAKKLRQDLGDRRGLASSLGNLALLVCRSAA